MVCLEGGSWVRPGNLLSVRLRLGFVGDAPPVALGEIALP